MMNQTRSREQLFQWITMTSFMLIDLALYLDTHPQDETAMDTYNHYSMLYQKATKEYSSLYGPLTLSQASPDKVWCWGISDNPWERGYC